MCYAPIYLPHFLSQYIYRQTDSLAKIKFIESKACFKSKTYLRLTCKYRKCLDHRIKWKSIWHPDDIRLMYVYISCKVNCDGATTQFTQIIIDIESTHSLI